MFPADSPVRFGPPQKRLRTTERNRDRDAAPIVTVKSNELWLEDGSIVLRVLHPCKRSVKIYKVHKSTLALHCSFFHDLFEGPQDEFVAASEKYEGLPVLDMHDAIRDVDDFLRAMYEPDFMLRHRDLKGHGLTMSDFPTMYGGILRLSRKYDAPRIRAVVAQAIQDQWPTTLASWDARETTIRAQLDDRAPQFNSHFYPDPAQTIRLAEEHDIASILPIAFYDLSRVFELYNPDAPHAFVERESNLNVFTTDDLRRQILGRAALRAHLVQDFSPTSSLKVTTGQCQAPDACPAIVDGMWTRCTMGIHTSSDPLDSVRQSLHSFEVLNMCVPCRGSTSNHIGRKRERLWEKLPDFFGLRDRVGAEWGK